MLVGRSKEIEKLSSLYEYSISNPTPQGQATVVFIQSDAGLGKTHLMQEFVSRETAKDPQFRYLRVCLLLFPSSFPVTRQPASRFGVHPGCSSNKKFFLLFFGVLLIRFLSRE